MDKKELLANIPPKPGVYKFKDKWGSIIYVGASKNLKKRVSSYFNKSHDHFRLINLVNSIDNIEYEIIDNIHDVFIRERVLIGIHRPKFNVRWLDDKQYPYLMITAIEDFPRLLIVREKNEPKNRYFGRQTQVKPLRKSLNKLRNVFPICDCKSPVRPNKKNRPCLNYDLSLCPGPCANKISKKDYNKTVLELENFLEGKSRKIITNWEKQMSQFAENQKFEDAARIRDRLSVFKQLTMENLTHNYLHFDVVGLVSDKKKGVVIKLKISDEKIVDTQEYFILDSMDLEIEDILLDSLKQIYQDENLFPHLILIPSSINEQDLFFEWISEISHQKVKIQVFSNPNDNKWTKIANKTAKKSFQRHFMNRKNDVKENMNYSNIQTELKKLLDFKSSIERINCIDISTLQGTATVASIISFYNGIPDKSNYRRFALKNIHKPDDTAAMKQVLTRFYRRVSTGKELGPDLLVVDGGKAQLSAVKGVFQQFNINIPYFGIAKKKEEIVLPNVQRRIQLQRNNPVLQLVVQMRDEAHRFAITYNRLKREKISLISELDQIPGLGEKRKKALLKHFSSVERIKTATVSELNEVSLIHKKLAEQINKYFRNRN